MYQIVKDQQHATMDLPAIYTVTTRIIPGYQGLKTFIWIDPDDHLNCKQFNVSRMASWTIQNISEYSQPNTDPILI